MSVPNDVMELFALIVPTLAVLAYTIPVFTNEFAVIENTLIVPEMFARPAFNSVFAQILSDQTAVTEDNVPVFIVLALAIPTILADAALIEFMIFAEPPDNVVFAVIVPPTTPVTAQIEPAFMVFAVAIP